MSDKAATAGLRGAGMQQLVGGALRLSGGTAIGQVITLAAMPAIAKLYGPAAFGIWAGWLALAGVIGLFACLRYDMAIALSDDDGEALHVAAVAILLAVVVSAASGLLLAGVWVLGVPGPWRNLGGHAMWIPIGALVIAWVGVATQWLARVHQVSGLAKAKIWSSVVTAAVQIALGWSGGAGGLILGDILGRSAGLWGRLKGIWREQASRIYAIQRKDLYAALRRYGEHSAWLAPTALINTLGQQAPLLLMLGWYGGTMGGQYSLVQRLMAVPVALLGQSVSQIFFPMMAKAYRRSARDARHLFLGMSALLAIIGMALIGFAWFLDESWLVTLLGREWKGVGHFLLPLSILSAAQLLVSTVSQVALVLGKQKWFSIWVAASAAASVGAMWIGHDKMGAAGAVWALAIVGSALYALLWLGLLAGLVHLREKLLPAD